MCIYSFVKQVTKENDTIFGNTHVSRTSIGKKSRRCISPLNCHLWVIKLWNNFWLYFFQCFLISLIKTYYLCLEKKNDVFLSSIFYAFKHVGCIVKLKIDVSYICFLQKYETGLQISLNNWNFCTLCIIRFQNHHIHQT